MPGVHLGSALVMPSANIVALNLVDDAGAALPISAAENDNIQSVATNCVGGTGVTYSWNGQTTASLPPRTTPDVLQTAMQGLSNIGSGNLFVTGFGPYQFRFAGTLGGVSQSAITDTPTGLIGTLPSSGTTIGTSSATVNVGDVAFTKSGSGWSAGFPSQGVSFFKCPIVGTGTNSAHYAISGLSVSGIYSLGIQAIDPAASEFGSPPNNGTNSDVGTLARFRVFDHTTPPTYRGMVTANPRYDGNSSHVIVYVGSFLCTSGQLDVYTADDADTGGALYAGPVYAVPAYTQLDTAPIPVSWPSGGTDRTVSVLITPRAIGSDQCVFSFGSSAGTGRDTMYVTSAGKLAYKNAGVAPVLGGTTLVAGTTYLATYVLTLGGAVQLYLNGTADTILSAAGGVNTIGSGSHPGAAFGLPITGDSVGPWTGSMGRGGVWNRGLTGAEITTLYNGGSVPAFASVSGSLLTGLLSYYDFLATNPGLDAKGVATLYSYLGPQSSEFYGSTGMPVTQIASGGAFPVTFTGASSGVTLDSAPIWCNATDQFEQRDWMAIKTLSPVHAGDTGTISIPGGVIGTPNGFLPTVTNFPIVNHAAGSVLSATPPTLRSLRVGYNVAFQGWFRGISVYANKAISGSDWLGASQFIPRDANGNPNVDFSNMGPSGGALSEIKKTISLSDTFGPDARGEPLAPFGNWTLMWDGSETHVTLANFTRGGAFAGGATQTCDPFGTPSLTGTNNKRVYTFVQGRELSFYGANEPCYDPAVIVRWPHHTPFQGCTNLRVYPPNVNPASPPKFDPAVIALLAGTKVFRTMTWFGVNGAPTCNYSEFLTDGEIPGPHRNRTIGVSLFEPYTFSSSLVYSHPVDSNVTQGTYTKVTTTTPHGLSTGSTVGFWHADLITPYSLYEPGGGNPYSSFLQQGAGIVYVLDATHFVYAASTVSGFTPFTPADMVIVSNTQAASFIDACLLCNAIGSDCAFWHNVAHGATDACIVKQAQDAAVNLAHGKDVVIEYSNEPWNFLQAFSQYLFMIAMGRDAAKLTEVSTPPNPLTTMGFGTRSLNGAEFYVLRAAQVRKVFQDAWNAAGRSETVRLVLNAQSGNASMTQAYLDYAANHDYLGNQSGDAGYKGPIGLAGDGICTAPYNDIQPRNNAVFDLPSNPTTLISGALSSPKLSQTLIDSLTLDQYEDICDLNYLFPKLNYWYYNPKDHLSVIRAHFHPDHATIQLYHYEGGPGYNGLMDQSVQQGRNSLAGPLHPRSYPQWMAYLSFMDANGVRMFADFGFAFGLTPEGPGIDQYGVTGRNALIPNYTTWYGINWDGVRGDGSDGKANSLVSGVISNPANGLAIVPKMTNLDGTPSVGSVRGGGTRVWNSSLVPVIDPGAAGGGAPIRPRWWIEQRRQQNRRFAGGRR